MKKVILCLFIILVIGITVYVGITVYGGDGPFGLEMGMSLEEVTGVFGESPSPNAIIGTKTLRYGYSVSAAKTPSEFESFILTITPQTGLSEIYLRTGKFSKFRTGNQSQDPKVEYLKLVEMVTSQYGPPVKDVEIPLGEDPFGGDPLDLSTVWEPGKHDIEKITMGWMPTAEAGSFMSILYVFDNRSKAIEEYPPKEVVLDVEVRP
jgi:hypothetical protein